MPKWNWAELRDLIGNRITSGELAEGARLPTEIELSAEFQVGRHTVRRAMSALALDGLLSIEQGRGTFVRRTPEIRYRIGRRTRFRTNLEAQGLTAESDLVLAEVVPAPDGVAAALAIAPGAPVHRVVSRGRADGTPISLSRSFHAVARFADFGALREQGVSVSEIYRRHGQPDYVRRDTTIFARRPDVHEAELLDQHPDQPVMVLQKTDTDRAGTPIGHSESIWSAHRVRFAVDSLDDTAKS